MGRQKQFDELSIPKCKRIVRPLVSKIHSLNDLYVKFPSKFDFDMELFSSTNVSGGILKFSNPSTAEDRLFSLKPYLSPELFRAYVEMFSIFKNIVTSMYDVPEARNITKKQKAQAVAKPPSLPRLTALAAHKLGKSVVLGTKSTYYSLNQTMLFEPDTIPLHLQKYHLTLADDIDEWLQMEPESVINAQRNDLLLGYVIHLLAVYLRTLLFALIPVLVQWLYTQGLASLRTLFLEVWLYLPRDARDEDMLELVAGDRDPSLELFWFFLKIGYWKQLALDIRLLAADGSAGFDSLLLEALGDTDRLASSPVDPDEVLQLVSQNTQHPLNTPILISLVARLITKVRKEYNSAKTSDSTYDVIAMAYSQIRVLVKSWLGLNSNCIFNSLDRGNEEIFSALFRLLQYLLGKCTQIIRYLNNSKHAGRKIAELLHRFKFLYYHVDMMQMACMVLKAYYLDLEGAVSVRGIKPSAFTEYFVELMGPGCDSAEALLFFLWLEERGSKELTQISQGCRDQLAL